jgi:protein-disulfide isomerase/uncharacterized membrane protein
MWAFGMLCILVAVGFSGLLSLKQLGLIDQSLPGCGPASACDELTSGAWGRIPLLNWPVSYLGLAWFVGMAVGWIASRRGISPLFRWLARLGGLASVVFIFVMLAKGSICPYCLGAHLANLAFLTAVELCGPTLIARAPVGLGTAAFLATTIVVAGGQLIQNARTQEQAEDTQRQFIEDVLAQQPAPASPAEPEPQEVEQTAEVEEPQPQPETPVEPPRDTLATRWTLGDPDAAVKVVMISDYQCPDCRKFESEMQEVLNRRDDVSLSVKHFPYCTDCNPNISRTMHRNACWAARSAETAGILGGEDAFWEFHQWLFEHRGEFPNNQLPPIVEELGFDRQEFTEVMMSDETLDRVLEDVKDGVSLGLFYTPMIFINGVELKWHLLPSSLTNTVESVANAIASGRQEQTIVAPPEGIDKYLADWKDGRVRTTRASNRDFRRPAAIGHGPRLTAFVDFISPNSAVFLHDLMEWESENGPADMVLRINPLNHDCNPNLPSRIKSRKGSCLAARAAKAAGLVGGDDAYFDMAFWLIQNGPSLDEMTEADMIQQSLEMGLDAAEFASVIGSVGVDDLIEQDVAEFKRHRFPHMPAVILEGRQIPRLTLEGHSVIGRALDEAQRGKP